MGSSIVFLFVPFCGMDSNISSLFTILECIECNNSFTVFAFFTNPGNFDGFEKNAYPTKPSFTSSIKFSLILANSELYIFWQIPASYFPTAIDFFLFAKYSLIVLFNSSPNPNFFMLAKVSYSRLSNPFSNLSTYSILLNSS